MKTLILIIGFFLFAHYNYAQHDGRGKTMTPEAKAIMQTNHMEQQLGFDASLREAITAVNLKFAEQQKEVRDSGIKGPEKREKMQVLQTERMSSLKELLTIEQFATYQEIHAKNQANKGKGQGKGMGKGRNGR